MITLHINNNKILKNSLEGITSEIYFNVNNKIFPEINWNDSIIVILNFWLDEIIKMKNSNTFEGDFLFMDGPLKIKIIKNDSKTQFKGFIQNKNVINEFINFDDFTSTVISGAIKVLTETKTRKWNNKDIENLEAKIKNILSD